MHPAFVILLLIGTLSLSGQAQNLTPLGKAAAKKTIKSSGHISARQWANRQGAKWSSLSTLEKTSKRAAAALPNHEAEPQGAWANMQRGVFDDLRALDQMYPLTQTDAPQKPAVRAGSTQKALLDGIRFQKPNAKKQKSLAQYRQWLETNSLNEKIKSQIGTLASKAQAKKWFSQSWAQLRGLQQYMPVQERRFIQQVLQERASKYLHAPKNLPGVIAFGQGASHTNVTTELFRQWADDITWEQYFVKNTNSLLAPFTDSLGQMTNEEFALMFALRYQLNELDVKAAKTVYNILRERDAAHPNSTTLLGYQRTLRRISKEAALCIDDMVSIMLKYPNLYQDDLHQLHTLLTSKMPQTEFVEHLRFKLQRSSAQKIWHKLKHSISKTPAQSETL